MKKELSVIDWRQSDLRLYGTFSPTLRTGRQGLLYIKNKRLIKLNGYEALLLQWFPKHLVQKVEKNKVCSNTALLTQADNVMTENVIETIGKKC